MAKKSKIAKKKPVHSKKMAKKAVPKPKKAVKTKMTAKVSVKQVSTKEITMKKVKAVKKLPIVTPPENTTAPRSKDADELESLLKEDANNDVELRDAEGRLYCKVRDCDELSIVDGYCRFHYLRLWKKIQLRKKILADGKLDKYIEDLTQRYPDKFVEMIRNDLRTEKDFLAAINELDIDESSLDAEMEDDQGLIDEVRGLQGSGGEDQGEDF